jgi:CRISPR-associated protein Csm3
MSDQLLGKYLLSGEIVCVTGLHIGGTSTGVEIGGVDNPVIKDPLTEQPYIPGSGLKGKLRSLTEWSLGLIAVHSKHKGYSAYECPELKDPEPGPNDPAHERWRRALVVGRLYGAASDETTVRVQTGPTRLTVRDAFATKPTQQKWKEWLGEGIYTEVKTENTLDRLTSEANPRPIERVPAGSAFAFEMLLDCYKPDDYRLWQELWAAMRLLEHSALGGSGSRGHGQMRFEKLKLVWRPVKYYREGEGEQAVTLPGETVASAVENYGQIAWPG